jgi:hypothetical protein
MLNQIHVTDQLMIVFMMIFTTVFTIALPHVFIAVLMTEFMQVSIAVLMIIFMLVLMSVFISKFMMMFIKVFMTVFMELFMKKYPISWTGCQMYIQNKFCISTVRNYLVAFGTLRNFLLLNGQGFAPSPVKQQKGDKPTGVRNF